MTCKDCLHYEVCEFLEKETGIPNDINDIDCQFFKDKSRFVELPCKIGDVVWAIRYFHCRLIPQEGTVSEMFFTKEMKLLIRVKYVGCGHWGEKIFATREEAEAAIKEK